MPISGGTPTSAPRRRRWRATAVVAALTLTAGSAGAAALGAWAPTASARADLSGPQSLLVPVGAEPDGSAVSLDASIWLPDNPGLRPVVLLAHGFGGTKDSVATQAAELQARGYIVITWTARGFGQSGGRIHLNDPAYEIADAKALVDLAAKRPDVLLDAKGDPRIGVMGASYGGALGLMLAGSDLRIDGVVAAITWNDLAQAFFPQAAVTGPESTPAGRRSIAEPGPFKQVWASNFFLSALAGTGLASPSTKPGASATNQISSCGRFDPTICALFVQASESGTPSETLLTLLREHSPKPTLSKVDAPTLLVQGMADSLFGLDQADATARALDGSRTPVAVRWTDGGHDAPSSNETDELAASYTWLDHYVARGGAKDSVLPTPGFVYPTAATRTGQSATLWSEAAYPGLGEAPAARTTSVPLRITPGSLGGASQRSDSGALLRPPGGQPASLVAIPGLAGLGVSLATYAIAALPGQSVAFDTDPITDGVTVVGSPTVELTVTSDQPTVTLFASLWRVAGDQPNLPHALVAPLRVPVTPGQPTTVRVSLPAGTYDFPSGSRWRVLVTSTEASFANDRIPARMTVKADSALTLPLGAGTRLGGTDTGLDTETRSALA
ncbi:MAG: alpha/beta fold hydrolase, partial [Dermatophilaceae bacterium]